MRRKETIDEYKARMKRFQEAKDEHDFYDTGLGRVVPDARLKAWQATKKMWEKANGPARDEKRK